MSKKASSPLPEIPSKYVDIEIPGTGVTMRGFAERHPLAPLKQPFIFDKTLTAQVAASVELGTNTMITGPSGCGKTQLIMQLGHQLGIPVLRFNFNGDTRAHHLVGQQRPKMIDGGMSLHFCEADLVTAMRAEWWVVFDEIDMASPHVLSALQPVLEEHNSSLHIPETGETVRAGANFRIFATGNTIGKRRQHASRFAGTTALNTALLSRFGFLIDTDYPPFDQEVARVLAHTETPEEKATITRVKGVCMVANTLRTDADFRGDFSTRGLIQWVRAIEKLGDSTLAFELTILNKMESTVDILTAKKAVLEVFDWGDCPPGWDSDVAKKARK